MVSEDIRSNTYIEYERKTSNSSENVFLCDTGYNQSKQSNFYHISKILLKVIYN